MFAFNYTLKENVDNDLLENALLLIGDILMEGNEEIRKKLSQMGYLDHLLNLL